MSLNSKLPNTHLAGSNFSHFTYISRTAFPMVRLRSLSRLTYQPCTALRALTAPSICKRHLVRRDIHLSEDPERLRDREPPSPDEGGEQRGPQHDVLLRHFVERPPRVPAPAVERDQCS